jgi:hypothetical protein
MAVAARSIDARSRFDKCVRLNPEISKVDWELVYEKLMMLDTAEFSGASVVMPGLVVIGSEAGRLTPRESSFVTRKSQGEPMLLKIGDEGRLINSWPSR